MKIIFISFILLIIQCKSEKDLNRILYKIISTKGRYLTTYVEEDVKDDPDEEKKRKKCLRQIDRLFNRSDLSHLFGEAFGFSGKYLGDFGFEEECNELQPFSGTSKKASNEITSETQYFLMTYDIVLNSFNGTDYFKEMKFINNTKFFTGICIFKDCIPYLNVSLNDEAAFFRDYAGIENIALMFQEDKEETNEDSETQVLLFRIMFFFLSGVFLLLVISSIVVNIIKLCFIEKEKEKSFDIKSYNSSFIYGTDNAEDIFGDDITPDTQTREGVHLIDREEKKPDHFIILLYKKFFIYIDIFDDISRLGSLKNFVYKNNGIESLSLVRFITMFAIIFSYSYEGILKFPPRNMFSPDFYTSYRIFLLKLPSFALTIWVVLDGLLVSYKLMCYVRGHLINQEKSLSIMIFIKFIFFCLPKVVLSLFIFFMFYFFGHFESLSFIKNEVGFRYYKENFLETITKKHDKYLFLYVLFPFLSIKPKDYFRFSNVIINEFYFFIFFVFFLYVSLKLKSKMFDIGVFFFGILSCMTLPYFLPKYVFGDAPEKENFTVKFFLGESFSFESPFLLVNFYCIGLFIGLVFFYFSDSVENSGLIQNGYFIPYSFSYTLIKKIHKFSPILKYFILGLLIFIMVALSSVFAIHSAFLEDSEKLEIEINNFYLFLYRYEKIIFSSVFGMLLIFLITYPRDSALKYLINSHMFLPMERTSFAFFCLSEAVTLMSFAIFQFQFSLTYSNLFFVSIGVFVLNSLISFVVTLTIETPIRKIVKRILKSKALEEEFTGDEKDKSEMSSKKSARLTKTKVNFKRLLDN